MLNAEQVVHFLTTPHLCMLVSPKKAHPLVGEIATLIPACTITLILLAVKGKVASGFPFVKV